VRGLLAALPGDVDHWTVVDMEAGLEHLTRAEGTLRFVDHLVVVIEPYAKAIETARRTIPIVPYDEAVRAADRDGLAPIDHAPGSPLVRAVQELVRALETASATP